MWGNVSTSRERQDLIGVGNEVSISLFEWWGQHDEKDPDKESEGTAW